MLANYRSNSYFSTTVGQYSIVCIVYIRYARRLPSQDLTEPTRIDERLVLLPYTLHRCQLVEQSVNLDIRSLEAQLTSFTCSANYRLL